MCINSKFPETKHFLYLNAHNPPPKSGSFRCTKLLWFVASSGRTLRQLLNMFYHIQRLYLLLRMFSIKQILAAKNMKYEWHIKSSLLDIFSSSSSTWNIMLFLIFRDHSFSTYAKFSTKLTFLIPWYVQYQNFKRLQLSLFYLNFL